MENEVYSFKALFLRRLNLRGRDIDISLADMVEKFDWKLTPSARVLEKFSNSIFSKTKPEMKKLYFFPFDFFFLIESPHAQFYHTIVPSFFFVFDSKLF